MPTVRSYPHPAGDLADDDVVLGDSNDQTVSVPASLLASYVATKITGELLGLIAQALIGQPDIGDADPPAAGGLYLSGGFVKYAPRTS